MKTDSFDPITYIENAFLDTRKDGLLLEEPPADDQLESPELSELSSSRIRLNGSKGAGSGVAGGSRKNGTHSASDEEPGRFRKTVMSAPRPRRSKKGAPDTAIDPALSETWVALPKHVAFLCSFFDDGVTKNYYRGEFKESREELVRRLLDPELSLEETSRLLGVCPATVRRYTNRGWLSHHRTVGGQRRFRLSNIVKFVDAHGRMPEE